MNLFNSRCIVLTALLTLTAALGPASVMAQSTSIPISDQPLFSVTGVPPLMMMVMSRDEQLFNKAYPDYTDLDGDGTIDTTYVDTFDYSGYFDPKLCYTYASNQFAASASATGTNSHQCSNAWSGNFLNWAAMSRLDLLRFVLYGGNRSTDTTTTVLERAYIPNDLHAWAKVYKGSDVGRYVPGASGAVTLCSASFGGAGTGNPTLRVALGEYPEWAATALSQCNWRETVYSAGAGECTGAAGDNSCWDDAPKSAALTGGLSGDFVVRVQVCGTTAATREGFCKKYTSSSGVDSYKPVGLLQDYGESGKLRFGLVSGTYSKPRSGGVLRRNIGKFAGNGTGNGCAAGDEVNLSNGQFCNQADGNEGIVNTIRRFNLTQWPASGNTWQDCNTYGILNRDDTSKHLNDPGTASGGQNCSAWGNPLSEMYAEALRYISGESKTDAFTGGTDLTGLPTPAWLDPYRSPSSGGNPYCANCSILVLASGLNSFDADGVPSVASLGQGAAALTKAVGDNEGVNGQGFVGRSLGNLVAAPGVPVQTATNTHVDLCTAKTINDLAQVQGICPDIPSMEGSYLMSGLAHKAWTTDLRPTLKDSRGNPKPGDSRNTVQTYAVALAESLPKFEIPVAGKKITLAPLCQANNTGTADALGGTNDKDWRSCFLGSVSIGTKTSAQDGRYVYGRALEANGSAGSFSLVWEDSLWGNDHDNDVVTMLTYCVGDACKKSTSLPTGSTPQELCFYTNTNYGGTATCPTSVMANQTVTVKSVKVPSGYTLTLYANTGQSGSSVVHTTNNASITSFNAKSFKITGGAVPPPPLVTTYAGYDICWRTTNSGNDRSSDCGSDGKPFIAADEVLVRVENMVAYAGNAMLTGYAITGSNADGIKRLTLRPGNKNGSILTQTLEPDGSWYKPMVMKFKAGSASAKQLENPLFYAAKYGGFTKLDTTTNKRRPPKDGEFPTAAVSADWAATNAAGTLTNTPSNYFLVRNPAKLREQLQQVFDSVLSGVQNIGSVAASTGRFTVGQTKAYQASYDPSGWVGELHIYDLNPNGSLGAEKAKASENVPTPDRRNIFVGVPKTTGSGFTAAGFATANLTPAMQTALQNGVGWPTTPATTIDNLVAYLRGDTSREQSSGPYRKRAGKLGDVVNSSPQVAYKTSSGYDRLTSVEGYDRYQAFVDGKTATTVFLGANDGMLHAFDGTSAVERFAYIPNAVVPKLGTLAKPGYVHTFSVDGTPAIGDAYLGNWRTIVVGSGGAGSRAVFAVDATNGSWGGLQFEFNSQTDPDMGYFTGIPSPPTITADTRWVTAFGNGYNGASGKAKLFVIDLADGSKVPVDDITHAANVAPNGLSTATIVDAYGRCPDGTDRCSDGIGDTIYAGDYRGNVWKFVLSNGRWIVSRNPLFQAADAAGKAQPITSGMYAVRNQLGGTIVYFGTGKYLDSTDNDPNAQVQVNSLYAIWDDGSGVTVKRSDLQQQEVKNYSNSTWTITQNQFGYKSANYPQGKMGWFLDLTAPGTPDPLKGERILATPVGSLDKLLVNAFRPTGEVCQPGGLNSFLELDALSGGAAFPGVGASGAGGTSGPGGVDIPGNGPPLGSPNPIISVPGQPGIPAIPGCPADDPSCVTPAAWCTEGVAGYPNCPCANPAAPPGTPSNDAACAPPPSCPPGAPGYPYCPSGEQCSLTPNPGTPVGNQPFQCRASWRQLR